MKCPECGIEGDRLSVSDGWGKDGRAESKWHFKCPNCRKEFSYILKLGKKQTHIPPDEDDGEKK